MMLHVEGCIIVILTFAAGFLLPAYPANKLLTVLPGFNSQFPAALHHIMNFGLYPIVCWIWYRVSRFTNGGTPEPCIFTLPRQGWLGMNSVSHNSN
jgi:hypothetical protein